MREIALFSKKIYTLRANFTRPPFVTVATNLNSVVILGDFIQRWVRNLLGPGNFEKQWFTKYTIFIIVFVNHHNH